MIIFLVLLGIILLSCLITYYIDFDVKERQADAETKKEFLLGMIPFYWWYVDLLEWIESLKERWRKLK